jgi:hypothetical protein
MGTNGAKMICFTKARIGLDPNLTRVKIYFEPANGKLAAGEPIKVCVQYKTSSLTGFYGAVLNNKVLDTEVESLNEQDIPTTALGPFQEDQISNTPATPWPASCSQL